MYENENWQRDNILESQHRRAVTIGKQRKGDYRAYENVKATVRAMNLSADEYERHMQQVAREMGI